MKKLSEDLTSYFKGKRVLCRFDWNVPLSDYKITSMDRLLATKDTLAFLQSAGAKTVILTHLGRPTVAERIYDPTQPNGGLEFALEPEYSFKLLTEQIATFFKLPIHYVENLFVEQGQNQLSRMDDGDIILADNVRFFAGETANDDDLSRAFAALGDIFVNDAFSCSHRAHATTVGIARHLESYAGFSLQTEISYLTKALETPKRPLWAIIGGAKVSTKIDILTNLAQKVDGMVIGGAMANTFLKAKGVFVGHSLVEDDHLETARTILQGAKCEIILPCDGRIALSLQAENSVISDFDQIPDSYAIYDIGPMSLKLFRQKLEPAHTIVWNGPMGVFENDQFSAGTIGMAKLIGELTGLFGALSVVGGGDTMAAISFAHLKDHYSFASTAGGAFLEWLEGNSLPGIDVLNQYNPVD